MVSGAQRPPICYLPQVDRIEAALSDRERQVLQALVEAHVASGDPVGSKTLVDAAAMGVSPATVRNVLSSLDERGFLAQPHSSAGRIPTDRGLRYYVDSLLQFSPPPPELAGEIARVVDPGHGVDRALRDASKVLARLARQTALVFVPPQTDERVAHVEFVRLRDEAVLFIWVSNDGRVHNRLMEWLQGSAPPAAELDRLGRRLTNVLRDCPLHEGRARLEKLRVAANQELHDEEARLIGLSQLGLAAGDGGSHAVHIEGTGHLLARDGQSVVRLRELLEMLGEADRMAFVFDEALRAPSMRVFIGAENQAAPLADHGVISAPVTTANSQPLGVIAVIGPRHLDYRRVVPLVDATAQLLTHLLA
jgi:heat-inducible transcriptional repressor